MVEKANSLNSQVALNPLVDKKAETPQPEGLELENLPVGTVLELQTGHNLYRLETLGEGKALISGHPQYCPQPTLVQIYGSTWGNGLFRWGFIGQGTRLEFAHPTSGVIRTSSIKGIRQLPFSENPN